VPVVITRGTTLGIGFDGLDFVQLKNLALRVHAVLADGKQPNARQAAPGEQ
jgi:hypothetical protein